MPISCGQSIQKKRVIRNAAVFASAIPEFARLGYIELVDARKKIPEYISDDIAHRIKRTKHQPIWVPGKKFPHNPLDIFELMKPSLRGEEIVWRQTSSRERRRQAKTTPGMGI